jgi:hypothetical protein
MNLRIRTISSDMQIFSRFILVEHEIDLGVFPPQVNEVKWKNQNIEYWCIGK